jgi:DNA polymerase
MPRDDRPGAEEWVPEGASVDELREAVQGCRGCELWKGATQAVFGAGDVTARLMLVGEQPGDREDRAGEPFVGPAGTVLDEVLREAGIDPEDAYVTNAVKHFRFEERGKRRIHRRPDVAHVEACMPWLEAELAQVDPQLIVCLGATAARAVFGRPVTIGTERGRVQKARGRPALVTIHPSAVLRVRDAADRASAKDGLIADLRRAAAAVEESRMPR